MGSRTTLEPGLSSRTSHSSRWNVVLLDDDDHSYEYVIEMLGRLFGHPTATAYEMAVEIDRAGRSVVFTAHRELAEFKLQQIHEFGADPRIERCRGSMSAVLEPAS